MSKQFTSTLYDIPTWTDSEMSRFSDKELMQLSNATLKMTVTASVTKFLGQPGKERTPANAAFAGEYLATKSFNKLIRPSRVGIQVDMRSGSLNCTSKEIRILTDKGESVVAAAAAVPTFNAKPRTGLDTLSVAITAVTKIKQGEVEMTVTPQQWQTAFGEPASAIKVSGLLPFFKVVQQVIELDEAYKSTVKSMGTTLSGYQFVDFVHSLLQRIPPEQYLYLHAVYSDKFLAAFDRSKPDAKGMCSHTLTKISRLTETGTRLLVPKFDPKCFIQMPQTNPDVKKAMALAKAPIMMYTGGSSLGMAVNKKDGTLLTAMKVASSQMQLRGGVEGGLGTFTASLGLGNLLAPGTRRQIMLVAMAKTAQDEIEKEKKRDHSADPEYTCYPTGVAIFCEPGDALAVASSIIGDFCLVMGYAEQRKCKFPEALHVIMCTVPPVDYIHVWFDEAPLASSEEDRARALELFRLRIEHPQYICWTAVWDPVFLMADVHVYPLPGRGSPDFKAFVSSMAEMNLFFDTPDGNHVIKLVEETKPVDWNNYVVQSNIMHTAFLLKPHYIFTPLTNILIRPRVEKGTVYQTEDGEWIFQDTVTVYLGDDDEEEEYADADPGSQDSGDEATDDSNEVLLKGRRKILVDRPPKDETIEIALDVEL